MRRRRIVVLLIAIPVILVASACVLGDPDEPGCRSDAECGSGRVCRAGACFRIVGDVDASIVEDDAG